MKFVLCIPYGGINDSLCQISVCYQYAGKSGRALVIDSSYSSGFCGKLGDLLDFQKSHVTVFADSPKHLAELYYLDTQVAGECVKFVVNTLYHDSCLSNVATCANGTQASFDFKRSYTSRVLVHASSGGGLDSRPLMCNLALTPLLLSMTKKCLGMMPKNYTALHIRNTDYKSNYRKFISLHAPSLAYRHVLVSSDDPEVICYASIHLRRSKVWMLDSSFLPLLLDKSTTSGNSDYISKTRNVDDYPLQAFLDLFLLSNASDLFCAPLHNELVRFSGYSQLAQFLNRRSFVRFRLLGSASITSRLGTWLLRQYLYLRLGFRRPLV